MKACKDCGSTTRKLTAPGPRCATCMRAFKAGQKLKRRRAHLLKTFKMSLEDYEELKAWQGGTCPICLRANGRTRALSVDHDHKCCPDTPTCGECTRGLLCGPCNDMLGHGRDDPEFFRRAMEYLTFPAFKRWKEMGNLRMGIIHKAHNCRPPYGADNGDVWECDECGKQYVAYHAGESWRLKFFRLKGRSK